MKWTGKNVLVTGADGFIGSHLAEALVELGANVTAMAQYNSMGTYGWLEGNENMRLVHGDITDIENIGLICDGQEIIFHLAALISVPHSSIAPRSYANTNTLGTMNVLGAGRGCEKVVCTSTSEVYGTAQQIPITELHPIKPQSPYAASKAGADAFVRAYYETYNVLVTTLRPFNTYGPRQSERAVMASIIRQSNGWDPIRLGDLSPKRDLTFVDDTVRAFLALGQSGEETNGEVYNAGSGKSISIGALAEMVAPSATIQGETSRFRNNDVGHLLADSKKLHDTTGWEPLVDLSEGISLTKRWWEKNKSHRTSKEYVV